MHIRIAAELVMLKGNFWYTGKVNEQTNEWTKSNKQTNKYINN